MSTLTVHQRRQARPIHRAAADQHDGTSVLTLVRFPPYPLITKLPPGWGETRRAGGGAIDFHDVGIRGGVQKPVDSTMRNLVSLGSTKATGQFATFGIPQVASFLPRFASFLPHACFCRCAPFFYFFSSFKRRERGREEEGRRSSASTGWMGCLKKHPRVLTPIHGFFVDCFLSKSQCWRGFAGAQASIHASTGRNAPVPPGGGS